MMQDWWAAVRELANAPFEDGMHVYAPGTPHTHVAWGEG